MKWINEFSNSKIPYYIYKLNLEDFILYSGSMAYNQSLIILNGTIYIIKIFTNNEIIPVAILNTNHIIHLNRLNVNNQNYYKLIAIEQTYLISFSLNKLKNKSYLYQPLIVNIMESYQLTLVRYEIMNNIFIHKYIKQRFIQLILFLSLEFGIIDNKKVCIPFTLSQKNLATMIGSNNITINKIITQLSNQMLFKYSSHKKFYVENIFTLISFYCY